MRAFRAWVAVAGVYNIVTSAAVAVPGVDRLAFGSVNRLNAGLGLSGEPAELAADPLSRLFVNTAGLVLCLVGVLLLWASRDLQARWPVPVANAVARLVFAAIVGHYLLVSGIPRLVLGMGAVDVLFAAVFLSYASALRRADRGGDHD
jgi:hypothetical protein